MSSTITSALPGRAVFNIKTIAWVVPAGVSSVVSYISCQSSVVTSGRRPDGIVILSPAPKKLDKASKYDMRITTVGLGKGPILVSEARNSNFCPCVTGTVCEINALKASPVSCVENRPVWLKAEVTKAPSPDHGAKAPVSKPPLTMRLSKDI
jgi:hypothetical protein